MILAVDVHYSEDHAFAVGVLFQDWADSEGVHELIVLVPIVAEYHPGEFYRRELPCIMALLEQLESLPQYIIIDGHVYLDAAQKPGLGKHLYDALQGNSAVIGVAKSRFKGTPSGTVVFRNKSKRPLYVTAAGLDEAEARGFIMQMHGQYRVPTLLRQADQLCRAQITGSFP